MHKAVSLSKNAARSKGLAAKATLFVYKPFYLKAILSETPRSSPTKYPLHWLVSLAASEIPILSPVPPLVWSPARRGLAGASLVPWDVVSLLCPIREPQHQAREIDTVGKDGKEKGLLVLLEARQERGGGQGLGGLLV